MLVLAALYVVLTRTWTGRAIRASSQNPSGAALVGIGATSTAALAFALGPFVGRGAAAGVAGPATIARLLESGLERLG